MSNWITLNIVTDDPETLADELTERSKETYGDDHHQIVVYPADSEQDGHAEGVDLVVSRFTSGGKPGDIDTYLSWLAAATPSVERVITLSVSDTTDEGTLSAYTAETPFTAEETYRVGLRGGVSDPCEIVELEWVTEERRDREVTPPLLDRLQERWGVRPTVAGNYR